IVRNFANSLAAGASRDDLRVFETWFESNLAGIREVKARNESNPLYRMKFGTQEIASKIEEIDKVCERRFPSIKYQVSIFAKSLTL
ncbi:hypothetical protein PENTCL1PPCAC_10063, partial [Pristionchus entomophagus]